MCNSLYLSFTRFDMLTPPKWAGLDNFKTMFFTDQRYLNSLLVTFRFVFIGVPLKLAFALFVAIIMNQRLRFIPFYRTVYYIPTLLGGSVAIAVLWRRLFSGDGAINTLILNLTGIQAPSWIASPKYALYTLILLAVWQFGSPMIIFLAGLKQIPGEYYEAAAVDGAGKARRFFSITLPCLSPIIFFNLVMQMICSIAVCATVVSCFMAAYAFARLKFILKNTWFAVMLLTVMLPGHVTTIPRYIMFNNFRWIDTYFPLLVPCFLATNAFFIFLMNQFIRSMPKDLDESATIDGCSKAGIFIKIIFPLSAPALVTTALFTFLWTWDDFFHQLLYLNTVTRYTVPLGLRLFMDSTGQSSWGSMFAMSVLSIIPCFILFFSLQRYFVQGITTTGIKG
jgi:multiple sugar transport system permease protein